MPSGHFLVIHTLPSFSQTTAGTTLLLSGQSEYVLWGRGEPYPLLALFKSLLNSSSVISGNSMISRTCLVEASNSFSPLGTSPRVSAMSPPTNLPNLAYKKVFLYVKSFLHIYEYFYSYL
ncbi:119aa long hypothetical protein [Pyrococcus horikoshii OT3]|uniref:Uncharacterized protein n=1 Tax=Pyrococcus horikoshii (strain ATCC 700860 / DSM 12428 / JCM 9974 / NBRC 100139 / OT-3) TaxID=70601 RepID=O59126_PYRHO|nr:119aa long hypothetical protein [Pyrococcus horikoshii OT3]